MGFVDTFGSVHKGMNGHLRAGDCRDSQAGETTTGARVITNQLPVISVASKANVAEGMEESYNQRRYHKRSRKSGAGRRVLWEERRNPETQGGTKTADIL
jgi:hypothetical protein